MSRADLFRELPQDAFSVFAFFFSYFVVVSVCSSVIAFTVIAFTAASTSKTTIGEPGVQGKNLRKTAVQVFTHEVDELFKHESIGVFQRQIDDCFRMVIFNQRPDGVFNRFRLGGENPRQFSLNAIRLSPFDC